jgi:hypothetical protein
MSPAALTSAGIGTTRKTGWPSGNWVGHSGIDELLA